MKKLRWLYDKIVPESIRKKRWFKYAFNLYTITVLVAFILIFVVGHNNLFVLNRNNKEIDKLNNQIDFYTKEIQERKDLINKLNNDNFFLETYARETYQMTRDSEDLFVFVEN